MSQKTLVALAAMFLVVSAPAVAQIVDDGARMERVADGVYAIMHDDATDAWPHGNTGVIVTREGVVVIDSTYLPSRARADIALIRKVTDKPVRYLVMTHWHFDHNNGNSAYRDAFPEVTIVSERLTRGYIELNNTWWPRMSTAPMSERRASMGKLEVQLATGKDPDGKDLTAADKTKIEKYVRQRRSEMEELSTLRAVAPDLVFDNELTLDLGGRRIELRDRGRANSPHDVTIYLPQDRILFTGDIVVQSPLPYVGASWPVSWIGVLRDLEALPAAAIVPGHGPLMRDHTYVRAVRELLETAVSRVEAMAREGKTLEQVQEGINLDDVRKRVPVWADAENDADWKVIMRSLSERVWRGVRGQG